MSQPTVAIIGSFRKHLPEMQEAMDVFTGSGIEVVSPLSTEPLEPGVEFVRFANDGEGKTDAEIETMALGRILGAKAVYVVCPDGYVGRTTAYEWGRVETRGMPAFFSDTPDEWFMRRYADGRVVDPAQLAELLLTDTVKPLNELISVMNFGLSEVPQGEVVDLEVEIPKLINRAVRRAPIWHAVSQFAIDPPEPFYAATLVESLRRSNQKVVLSEISRELKILKQLGLIASIPSGKVIRQAWYLRTNPEGWAIVDREMPSPQE